MRNLRIAAAWAAGEIHKYLGGAFSPEKKIILHKLILSKFSFSDNRFSEKLKQTEPKRP